MASSLYTTKEAAAAVGVSRQTLQTWIIAGKVKPPKVIGSVRVWNESDLAALRRVPRRLRPKKK